MTTAISEKTPINSAEDKTPATKKPEDDKTENINTDNSTHQKKRPKRKHNNRPGRLSGSLPFEIHTLDAQSLFGGYIRNEAVGLLQFGGLMTTIWNAAEKDDPYADWYLLKVYDELTKLRNTIASVTQDYQQKLQEAYGRTNLHLMPFASQKPVVKPLWFRTQYGYLGANLIADFDTLVRTVLTANRIGVLLDKPINDIKDEWIDKIVALFKLPARYQSFAVTRLDVVNNTDVAKKAQDVLGKLPKSVLDKQLRAPFAPYINLPRNSEADNKNNTDFKRVKIT